MNTCQLCRAIPVPTSLWLGSPTPKDGETEARAGSPVLVRAEQARALNSLPRSSLGRGLGTTQPGGVTRSLCSQNPSPELSTGSPMSC